MKQLIQIAERAASLDDRLEKSVAPFPSDANQEQIRLQINAWKETVAKGDDHLFLKRLRIDDIDPDSLPNLLGPAHYLDPQTLPAWIHTLQALIDSTHYVKPDSEGKQQAFEEVLLAFVAVARKKLDERCRSCIHLIEPEALKTLERTLLLKLSRICSRPMALELNIARLLERLKGATPQDRYNDFVKRIGTRTGMFQFFSEYSVAGRLTASQVDQWIESNAEFILRLQTDLPGITEQFCAGQNPGPVIAIEDYLSDSHNGGRTSKQLTFASGFKLIYKPKNLSIDSAFQDLLKWINATQTFLPQKTFSLLNHQTHGWVEFLMPSGCDSSEEIEKYFKRAGMLLCLLHTLGANDCHSENIFACGEYPVIVDLETLIEVRPVAATARQQNADEAAQEVLRMSLLHTGMLPNWIYGDAAAGGGSDFSGLMGGTAQKLPFRSPEWVESNTDKMRIEFKFIHLPVSPSQSVLRGGLVCAAQHQQSIEQGFVEMYAFLIEQKENLQSSGLLDRIASAEIRYLHRATAEYGLILQKSLNPSLLRDGIDRSIHLDLLWRNLFLRDSDSMSPLVKLERQALERMDIPYFTVEAEKTSLISDRKTEVPFVQLIPAGERLRERLATLNLEAMKKQIGYLRASISMRAGGHIRQPSQTIEGPLLDQLEFIQAATRIGEDLKRSAIYARDGSVTWLGADYVSQSNQYTISPVRNTFYSGKTGIALFFAALDRFVPERGYASLALATLQSVRQIFQGEKAQFHLKSMELGAMSGTGSLCWSFLRIGELLNERTLMEDAAAIALRITRDQIVKDRHHDIILGSAGAILSLITLHRSFPSSGFLEPAVACGEHLLVESVSIAKGIRVWQTLRDEKLTGFSHGASGYAYSLLRLFEATGRNEFRDAALEAFAYERSIFSAEHGNWPDLRSGQSTRTEQSFMTGWCHGAPGIALARIGVLHLIRDERIKQEIEIALNTTLGAGLHFQDDMCCGNFSRIETLLIASRYLKRPDLYDAALRRASGILHLASQTGGDFRLEPAIGDGLINPGFMKGIAGVGYGLLRLADKEGRLPSPLLM